MLSALKVLTQNQFRKWGYFVGKTTETFPPYGFDPFFDLSRLRGAETVLTVFDVGAHNGQTALKLASHFSGARIHSFEPIESSYRRLRANTALESRIEPVQKACGRTSGEVVLRVHPEERSYLNSLLPVHQDELAQTAARTEAISLITLDEYCGSKGIDRVDLLKIDTEGFELEVLAGAEKWIRAGKVDFILAECEFAPVSRERHASFFDLYAYLIDRGYRLVTVYTGGTSLSGFLWGDLLFARAKLD